MQQQSSHPRAAQLMLDCIDGPIARRLIATNLLAIAGGLIAGVAPVGLKGLIDAAKDEANTSRTTSMAVYAVAYLASLALGRFLGEVRPMLASATEQRLYGRLRQRFFHHTLHLPFGFHLNERAGATVHALNQGITGCQIIVYSVLNSIVPVVIEVVTVTAVLLSLDQPLLTSIFAATAVAYVAVATTRTRALTQAAQRVSAASADVSSAIAEGLTNIEPVKCFGVESRLVDELAGSTSLLEQRWSTLYRRRLRSGFALLTVFVASMCASLVTAIYGLREGSLTIGGFVLANMYMVQLLRPLDMLAAATRDVSQALAFIGPMLAILQTPQEVFCVKSADAIKSGDEAVPTRAPAASDFASSADSSLPPSPQRSKAPRIQFCDVRIALGNSDAVLSELNLDIPAGRTVAIVGASGCGKSTMARLLLRLWKPERGTIFWNDQPIEDLPLATLREMVAIVPQDTVLFNATIAMNIAIGRPGATSQQIERAARLAQLHDLVSTLPRGYATVVGERGMKLSGGQRQRIAIARAVLRDPLVFVFDEATSMLDSPTEQEILHDLRKIATGRTTIMIAHRLSTLRHADKIVVLAGGGVAEQGDHDTLLTRDGLYASMWRAQRLETIT
ncbi:ABC transporter ATP-binding protein [Paucibacter sp. R3-3]|uniref:ABC transporter ATP-binding protein n=1 Tax=Roseateles agri TaxID=3098619 RepID=A0ABU5DRZ9_9BURK|nr:ABC transporter ATP-binding protein [Paucibacter sp. R3-3]MDY0749098.1 ABC transporter ATP-binding protein [Paucibacter sp. R3-3]